MIETIKDYYLQLSTFGQAVIVLNVLLFITAGLIFKYLAPTDDKKVNSKRTRWMRGLNLLLLLIYVFDGLYFERIDNGIWLKQISQSGLVLLISALFIQFSSSWALRRYGKLKMIDEEEVNTRTYKSEMMHLIIIALTFIAGVLLLINIWKVTNWLQATGVLGGLLVVLFATKDAWATDSVHGLILLYNQDLEPGVVCRIPELGILGITRKISLTQTTFRDIVHRHSIIVPNSKLRTAKIEILNRSGTKFWNDYIEYKIGYDTNSEQVEAFFARVWTLVCELEAALNIENKPKISLVEAGDHAIVWRIHYQLENIYRMKAAKFAINKVAFQLQEEFDLSLATPITHKTEVEKINGFYE